MIDRQGMYTVGRRETYTIMGDPTPLARARHTRGRVYDSQKAAKRIFSDKVKDLYGRSSMLEGAIALQIEFVMAIPESWSKRKRLWMKSQPHIITPDGSNMLKYFEDCCNLILYHDDCQLYDERLIKYYDDGLGARTIFTLEEHYYDKASQKISATKTRV